MKKIKGGENDIRLWGGVVLAFEFKKWWDDGGGGVKGPVLFSFIFN